MKPAAAREDFAPLADRLAVLQTVRFVVALAAMVISGFKGDPRHRLVPIAITYVVLTAAVELLRRSARKRGLRTVSATLLLDGVFLALAVALTGGYDSPLLFLVFLQVMAVTLLVSYRTGLKIAVWYVLLLFAGHAAAEARVGGISSPGSQRDAVLSGVAFLLFAVGAAAFSSVNERALRVSRGNLRSLVELGSQLEEADEAIDMILALTQYVCDHGCVRGAVIIERGRGWQGVVSDGHVEVLFDYGRTGGPLVSRTKESGLPQLVRELDEDGVATAVMPDALNVVAVPLSAEGETLGVVLAEWDGGRHSRIPASTVDAISQAAARGGLALRNARQVAEIERLATRDGLTGLANRRLLEESLEREVARARRQGAPLSLVVLDVDHFKDVNDTLGHQAGDRLLREIGQALTERTKASDLACRYGGDEFLVLLPECAGDDAVAVAERLRRAASERVVGVRVTLSAGVASLPGNAEDPQRLVAAADAALYDAKRSGRNRTANSNRRPEGPDVIDVRDDLPAARR